MEAIWEMATQTGIWAVLFVFLFFIQIKDSKTREGKYQETIAKLAASLEIVADIEEKITAIKNRMDEADAKKEEGADEAEVNAPDEKTSA